MIAAVIAILALIGFTATCLSFYIDARLNKCLASDNSANAAFRRYAQHLKCQFDTYIAEISRLEEKVNKIASEKQNNLSMAKMIRNGINDISKLDNDIAKLKKENNRLKNENLTLDRMLKTYEDRERSRNVNWKNMQEFWSDNAGF